MNNLEVDSLKNLMENHEINLIKNLLKSLINNQQPFADLLYDFMEKIVRIESSSLRFQCEEILKEGDIELVLYLISRIITHLEEEDLLFLFDNPDYDLFEIIINLSKYITDTIKKSMDTEVKR